MIQAVKDHSSASLIALAMIVGTVVFLAAHGMKDETLLAILATGAVGIANTIAGVPTNKQPPAAPIVNSTVISGDTTT